MPRIEPPPAELVEAGQMLSGSITNTLACPLRNCILAHGVLVYELGTIGPGETARVGPTNKRSELKTLLTGRRFVANEGVGVTEQKFHEEATPYDQSSAELPYILRTMMFYGAAGGYRYTGLWNAYQDFVDFSSLLKTDCAILVAEGPDLPGDDCHGSRLFRDGQAISGLQDRHFTMYRFVFPVKKE